MVIREHEADELVTMCENGHANPEGQHFCGKCGIPMVATTAICPAGHINLDRRRFCGDCGAPTAAPEGVTPGTGSRWTVDPTGRHEFRYWDGSAWLDHVADNAKLGTDPFVATNRRRPENWIGIAAGAVTLVLLIAAAVQIGLQLSKKNDSTSDAPPAASAEATASTSASAPSSTPTSAADSSAAPAPVQVTAPAGPVGGPTLIATRCTPNSPNGLTADGSIAYCQKLATTDTYMWSLNQADIPFPVLGPADVARPDGAAIGVCMAQTARTRDGCLDYLRLR